MNEIKSVKKRKASNLKGGFQFFPRITVYIYISIQEHERTLGFIKKFASLLGRCLYREDMALVLLSYINLCFFLTVQSPICTVE